MPSAVVLGTAQDGGFPHAGCRCVRCEAARADPARARRVACLGLVAGGDGFLVDATPDLPRQVTALPRLFGILLTHAHMGHVAGLLWLGREAMAVRDLPIWLGAGLARHLAANEPWATLVREGYVEPRVVSSKETVALAPSLAATPLAVPHRGEWSETFAWRIEGPAHRLLWLPDIDRFEPGSLETLTAEVDLAFLDGTFWSDEELPGRDLAEIPHPRISDTARRLAAIRPRAAVSFVHLNHSNPCLDPNSAAARELDRIYAEAGLTPAAGAPVAPEDVELSL